MSQEAFEEGRREEVVGRVGRQHRLGKGLCFLHLSEGTVSRCVTFEADVYDASGMDFPNRSLRGYRLRVQTEMQWRERSQRWLRTALRARLLDDEPDLSQVESEPYGRRRGVAACAGWVRCPLCRSQRCFNRGAGLRQHLATVHPSEDAEQMAAQADHEGIYATRGGSLVRSSGSRVHQTSKAELPGLVAARDGDVDSLQRLLLEGWHPFQAGQQDRNGSSALDWAAGSGHLECVKLLLPYGKGLQLCRRDGRGPVHWACRHGQLDMLQFLLEAKAGQVEDRAADGTTPLMLASFGNHVELMKALLDLGADPEAQNSWDCDAGHFAGLGGSIEAVELLNSRGLCLTRPQVSGHTVLHKAAERGHLSLVLYLFQHGHVNVEDVKEDLEASQWQRAHLPSALARRHGHEACAVELERLKA